MGSVNDSYLCNGIPVDHRLKRFLPSAKQKHSQGIGKHADIVESFGNTMIRDDKTYPSGREASFAAWLAKPDMQGGLVIALLQPARSQDYMLDFQRVKNECATLAYLEESLTFLNGPGSFSTTSIFDAFPFIMDPVPPEELTGVVKDANNKFLEMLEAKKPEVVFACWRVMGHLGLAFSGRGIGGASEVERLRLSNGHVVRVVNGFHPSYTVNYCPNESCFRRLFAVEMCKAFCELNTTWQEEDWVSILRKKCKDRVPQLRQEKGKEREEPNSDGRRILRGSWEDDSTRKCKAYIESFDSGLKRLKQIFHQMVLSDYRSRSSWDLYTHFVVRLNTSEGICDTLLAVSEALNPSSSMSGSSLKKLKEHISDQTRDFLKNDIPDISQCFNSGKNVWSLCFATRSPQGFKWDLEKITMRFIDDLESSFFEVSRSWGYYPDLLHDAFKSFAISFEESLGKEYDKAPRGTLSSSLNLNNFDNLGTSFSSMSISSSRDPGRARIAGDRAPARSPSSPICYNCDQPGHYSTSCILPKKGSTTPSRSSSSPICYNCDQPGHYSTSCTLPKKGSTTPSRSSSSQNCYNCGLPGHYSSKCTAPKRVSTTQSRSPSNATCYNCGQVGHYSSSCASPRK